MQTSAHVVPLLAALALAVCGNECSFTERCDGGVRNLPAAAFPIKSPCEIDTVRCVAPNAACLQDGMRTVCVADPRCCDGGESVPGEAPARLRQPEQLRRRS